MLAHLCPRAPSWGGRSPCGRAGQVQQRPGCADAVAWGRGKGGRGRTRAVLGPGAPRILRTVDSPTSCSQASCCPLATARSRTLTAPWGAWDGTGTLSSQRCQVFWHGWCWEPSGLLSLRLGAGVRLWWQHPIMQASTMSSQLLLLAVLPALLGPPAATAQKKSQGGC